MECSSVGHGLDTDTRRTPTCARHFAASIIFFFAVRTLEPTSLLGWTPLGHLYLLKKLYWGEVCCFSLLASAINAFSEKNYSNTNMQGEKRVAPQMASKSNNDAIPYQK